MVMAPSLQGQGWGEVSEALTAGPGPKGGPNNSAVEINNLLMQYFKKIKINGKIHDEQNVTNFPFCLRLWCGS